MDMLAAFFKGLTGREIVNQTGLRGRYDFEWSGRGIYSFSGARRGRSGTERSASPVFRRFSSRTQAGRLQGPVQIWIISQVSEASKN